MKPGLNSVLLFTICVAVLFAAATQAGAQEKKKFTQKDLPSVVREAFEKSYPNAKIKGVGKETENGKTYYEIESIDRKMHRDLLYTPEGQVYETEEGIAAGSLPEAVKKALEKEHPKCTIEKAEKTMHGSSVGYELRVKTGKKRYEIAFDESGKVLESKEVKAKKEKKEKDEEEEDDD